MSTIVVLKDSDTLIFGTDSRVMEHDFSGVVSDATEKIFEIAPETFIATSGRKVACDFQVARARTLAVALSTTDIQTIGAALGRESLPCLMALVERLRPQLDEVTRQAVSGESLLHGCILVGRTAGGQLGYVSLSYRVRVDGTIECVTEAYFEARRKITATSGAPVNLFLAALSPFVQDMATWIDPPERVIGRLLEAMKRSALTIGGPDQVVRLDSNGAHWISRPPQAALPLVGELLDATVTALVSLISPVISGGSITGGYMDMSSPGYSSGNTYGLNALVTYNGIQYKSTSASNYNHQPDLWPAWWTLRPSISGASIAGSSMVLVVGGTTLTINSSAVGGYPGITIVDADNAITIGQGLIQSKRVSNPNQFTSLIAGSLILSNGAGATKTITATS